MPYSWVLARSVIYIIAKNIHDQLETATPRLTISKTTNFFPPFWDFVGDFPVADMYANSESEQLPVCDFCSFDYIAGLVGKNINFTECLGRKA